MKALLEQIVKMVVKHPEDVTVMEFEEGGSKVLEIVVHSEDVGQVIGKDGRTIHAITRLYRRLTGEDATIKVVR
ncbi:MAG: KH domain-containing protein [Thermotogae bacterium]|nr:KH domain-containing protein [Thermotogota bacterium]